MKKKILFYSSVSSVSLFETQKFYKTDIDILKDLNFNVRVTNKISDFLFFWKYDTAYIYFYRYGLFVSVLARLFGKKVFFTGGIDDLDPTYSTPIGYSVQKVLFKLCYFFSNKSILVSTSDCENVKSIYKGILPSKATISFHSIEVEAFLCEDSQKKGNDFTTIAWMGSEVNVIRKGVDLSLHLFSLLIKNYPEYALSKFIIIGKKGAGTNYLLALSSKLNILDKVIFTDEVNELKKIDLLKSSRYYMQLSQYEGFGIAATEALAAQNIVINSGRGGLIDSVGCHGVQIDINEDLTTQIPSLHQRIQDIDAEFLKYGEKYVIDNFSYSIRKNDLKEIIV